MHRHACENIAQADALLFGRVTHANVVRGAIEACRLEVREPAGVRLGRGGDAV